jgi:hypothetical protein
VSEEILKGLVAETLKGTGLSDSQVSTLAGLLLWRIGREGDDGPLTVRVGLASSGDAFSELPKLRNLSEAEIFEAIQEKAFRVEWVGEIPQ